jgi:hypothetical protein
MPFGERVQGFPRNELLRDLPLELDAVRAMLGHGFHPSKAQLTLSKQKPQPVRPKGRTPDRGRHEAINAGTNVGRLFAENLTKPH